MKALTPIKAIRAKCIDCCCGSEKEVKLCQLEKCPLHPFRFGRDPGRKGSGNKKPISHLDTSAQNTELSSEKMK